ncbi:MAG: YcgL domain-containing protein [Pseudomonadota bacterium]
MRCFVYKSRKKAETYLYIPQKGEFSSIPNVLMKVFGVPEFALEFELTADRKLAVADAKDIIDYLGGQGFYLQMPSENDYPI